MADLGTVDVLARLRLAARRSGLELRVRDAPADLQELIAFVGLAEVLGLEPRGQAEERGERLRGEEEGELGDAAV
jgi:gamma-glutamyl:cysteine ligase YbdK (ATP-grasp superfamily)